MDFSETGWDFMGNNLGVTDSREVVVAGGESVNGGGGVWIRVERGSAPFEEDGGT
jgi:hypothetical protein